MLTRVFAVMALLAVSVMTATAGKSYYKNLSITVKNPDSAKGVVYLTPYYDSDTSYCQVTISPNEAKVKGNLSNDGDKFKVYMYALPADGYVLDCLTTPAAYRSGNYRSEYLGNTDGYPISSFAYTLDNDTATNCMNERPALNSSMAPVYSEEYYSIFTPSKKMTVRNRRAGDVADAVRAGIYGEAANDLIVTGPLNDVDLMYLNVLSQQKGLIRLDLSGASFTSVCDSAFYKSGLYELKLPSTIKSVGDYAFAHSIGLKPVKLPANVEKGVNTIAGCNLMNLLGVKEDYVDDYSGFGLLDLFFGL